ncbi:MAG: hypothetical protein GEU78_08055 [Actinobacteria bacterium]|nr:hypothetical protein [Actinomycetota bacterium]
MYPNQKMSKALEVMRSHDEHMPAQRLVTFLFVAQRGKATREDVMEATGMGLASAYRNLMILSSEPYFDNDKKKHQGLGLLKASWDDNKTRHMGPRRRRVWEVTAKGLRVLSQIEDIMRDD